MTTPAQEQIARAIWSIRREDEDRCDMELEDMGKSHSVWKEAAAVVSALAASETRDVGVGERIPSQLEERAQVDDAAMANLAETYDASVEWANDADMHHILKFTPPQLRAMLNSLAARASEATPNLEAFDSHEVDHGSHIEVVPHYREAAPSAVALLKTAIDRMDRARAILIDDNPRTNCNWGMLDTADLKREFGEAAPDKVLPGEFTDAESLFNAMGVGKAAPVAVGDAETLATDLYRAAHYGALGEFHKLVRAALASQAVLPSPNTVNWRDRCAALIDIYDDGMNNAPEHRCYVDGAWKEELDETRAALASQAAPVTQDAQQASEPSDDDLERLASACGLYGARKAAAAYAREAFKLYASQPAPAVQATAAHAGAMPGRLRAIHTALHTQDNRITREPMFAVQERKRVYGIDTDYGPKIAWANDDGDEVDAEKAAELEAAYQQDGDDRPGNYKRLGYHEYWDFVTACFTEQGCKDYIACNGHNLHETRIYAYGTYRNAEWATIRDFLMSDRFAAAPTLDAAKGEPT